MTHLVEEPDARGDEQDYTICPHCGEDLPHHNCEDDERERVEF